MRRPRYSERELWLVLSSIPGLGFARLKSLTETLGSANCVWEASPNELTAVPGIGPKLASAICEQVRTLDVDQYLSKLAMAQVQVVTYLDAEYPQALRSLSAPPSTLYYQGCLSLLGQPLVAVIGSRKMPMALYDWVAHLSAQLAEAGVVVVSGLARGADTAAHLGAMSTGTTVAVLPCGLAHVYPHQNRNLATRISQEGLIMSEFSPWTRVRGHSFAARNRIVVGLAQVVIVTAAGEQSGSLITAGMAYQAGKPIFAVPGAPFEQSSIGTNDLIKNGKARLLTTVDDVLGVVECLGRRVDRRGCSKTLQPSVSSKECPPASSSSNRQLALDFALPETQSVLECLSGPMSIEAVQQTTGLDPGRVLAVLSELELEGRVKVGLDGKWYKTIVCNLGR